MNLQEIADTLPNGLNDLLVDRLSIDFLDRVLTLDVSVWVGDVSNDKDTERERRRYAKLRLHGLQFCVLEPPDPRYPYDKSDPLWLVDLADSDPATVGRLPIPEGTFSSRFFVNQWNAFIHVAARSATLDW